MQQFPFLGIYQQTCDCTFIHNNQTFWGQGGRNKLTDLEIKSCLP